MMDVNTNYSPQAISYLFISYEAQQLPKSNCEGGTNSEKSSPSWKLHVVDSYVWLFILVRKSL